jgi:hypothetical protein
MTDNLQSPPVSFHLGLREPRIELTVSPWALASCNTATPTQKNHRINSLQLVVVEQFLNRHAIAKEVLYSLAGLSKNRRYWSGLNCNVLNDAVDVIIIWIAVAVSIFPCTSLVTTYLASVPMFSLSGGIDLCMNGAPAGLRKAPVSNPNRSMRVPGVSVRFALISSPFTSSEKPESGGHLQSPVPFHPP